MPSGSEPSKTPNYKRSKVSFSIAAALFFIMAILWSVDSSIVYIFLGAGGYFLFLGFYFSPSVQQRTTSRPGRMDAPPGRQTFGREGSLSSQWRTVFQQAKIEFGQGAPAAVKGRKILVLVMIIFAIVFTLPILISLFASDNTSAEGTNYIFMGQQQYDAGNYDSAFLNYRNALRADPESADAALGYGKVMMMRHENDSAVLMFDRVLELDPDRMEAVYNKGLIYYDQQKYNEGVTMITDLLKANPDYYDAMLLLGDFYYIEKNYNDALVWYNKAYTDGGIRSRILCHVMAYIYDTNNNYDKAIPLYQEALSYDSTVVEIYQRLGEIVPGDQGNAYRSKASQIR
ncbi:MAG TPA: tetratricopeptide repeat protein [Chryseolinea sp.]|nr:tetratricopeptide repeat protein [Chryseolinea sp.]